MARIPIDSVIEGDVLSMDVVVKDVVIFDAGTVLVKKCVEIMMNLDIKEVDIEGREGNSFRNLKEAFANIDKRFSYVEENKFMLSLKYLVKDVVSIQRGYR
jgi:hypothetical protein